jgi:hypothetical protein
MTNERDSVHVALEAIVLFLYALNSYPIPGADISWSLVAVGREFAFPIDYSTDKNWELTSSQSVWSLIQRTLPHAFLPSTKLPSYLSRNTTLTVVSSSIPTIQILTRTPLMTLYLPAVPFDLMHPKNVSTNCPTN